MTRTDIEESRNRVSSWIENFGICEFVAAEAMFEDPYETEAAVSSWGTDFTWTMWRWDYSDGSDGQFAGVSADAGFQEYTYGDNGGVVGWFKALKSNSELPRGEKVPLDHPVECAECGGTGEVGEEECFECDSYGQVGQQFLTDAEFDSATASQLARTSTEEQGASLFCDQCGTAFAAESKFCGGCGRKRNQ